MEAFVSQYLWIWYGFLGLVLFDSVIWHASLGFIARTKPELKEDSYDGPPNPAPKISMLVAARNEEHNIEACVGTLIEQDYPNLEIIAVNDRSEDRTLEMLRKLEARSNGRLTVVNVEKLEDGWFGKNNAMREGIARSTGDWLCFTDADCWFTSKAALSVSIRDAIEHKADFLTLLPTLTEHSTWERIIQPACGIMMVSWFLPLRVNNPKSKLAYANGQFMLTTRACYDGIGGHTRVRAELNEDMVLGSNVKKEGFKLRLAENVGLSNTRMYRSVSEAWHGWSRIFHGSIPLHQLTVAAGWHIVFAVGPWISLALAAAGWGLASPESTVPWAKVTGLAALALLAHQTVLWRVYNLFRNKPIWSLAHGMGATVLVGMLLNAITKSLGLTSTTWRGVTYRSGKLTKDAEPQETSDVRAGEELVTKSA